jgi:hypothetical protein
MTIPLSPIKLLAAKDIDPIFAPMSIKVSPFFKNRFKVKSVLIS